MKLVQNDKLQPNPFLNTNKKRLIQATLCGLRASTLDVTMDSNGGPKMTKHFYVDLVLFFQLVENEEQLQQTLADALVEERAFTVNV